MRKVKFGFIGLGLMGREFASAAARWFHLEDMTVRPEIVAVCSAGGSSFDWYRENVPTVKHATTDYRELLALEEVEAVYCAVPHHLHEEIYTAVLDSGKHLLGEKPFGIDKEANGAILQHVDQHPEQLARCVSQFPFYPGAQQIARYLEEEAFGTILEVNAGFLHSSDLDPAKPVNWKRRVEYNGAYGSMGDLGMHVLHIPLRAGWQIRNVRAVLSNIITERPDGSGGRVACDTWDNATLLCGTRAPGQTTDFPMTLRFHRIAPGEKNSWYIEILGTRTSVRFSTKNPKRLEVMEYSGGEQSWQLREVGYETPFPAITNKIFEFGFSDALLQMWAGYLYELDRGRPLSRFTGCVTPAETAAGHAVLTAALKSHAEQKVVEI